MSKMKDWNPVRVPLPFVSTLPSGSLMCVTSLFRCNSSMSLNERKEVTNGMEELKRTI